MLTASFVEKDSTHLTREELRELYASERGAPFAVARKLGKARNQVTLWLRGEIKESPVIEKAVREYADVIIAKQKEAATKQLGDALSVILRDQTVGAAVTVIADALRTQVPQVTLPDSFTG